MGGVAGGCGRQWGWQLLLLPGGPQVPALFLMAGAAVRVVSEGTRGWVGAGRA